MANVLSCSNRCRSTPVESSQQRTKHLQLKFIREAECSPAACPEQCISCRLNTSTWNQASHLPITPLSEVRFGNSLPELEHKELADQHRRSLSPTAIAQKKLTKLKARNQQVTEAKKYHARCRRTVRIGIR